MNQEVREEVSIVLLFLLLIVMQVNDDVAVLWPADALLHFPAAAVGGDVGEGESAVDHQTAELRRFCVEEVMSAERTRWRTQSKKHI